jgi:hypothetical protein
MPKFPVLRLRGYDPPPMLPALRFYGPVLTFSDLQLGVDNLRYDVFLSPRITSDLSFHLARFIRRFGEVDDLLTLDLPAPEPPKFVRAPQGSIRAPQKVEPADLKTTLLSIHQAILAHAKTLANPSIDLLGRLAILKFLRFDLQAQFSKILAQCRMKAKAMEGIRQATLVQTHDRVSSFQVRKKIILRRVGEEVFHLIREIERETLARTRRSLLGELPADTYRLFLNPLLLTEDGRDDYLCAGHYYMFGNFEKDPDRFSVLRQYALDFLRELGYGDGIEDVHVEQALNVPENATALVGTGNGEDATAEDRHRKDRLDLWTHYLQREGVLPYVVASYEAVPLLPEYSPTVNPQQLKNALVFREEAERVEKIVGEGRLQVSRLFAAVNRVAACRASERSRFAARLMRDLFCYHRDLRGLEAVNAGFDSINLVSDDKMRELSALNGMLYEFLPPDEQKSSSERVLNHVILKADVRDSSNLTRSLMAKGMNAASYFSLNFYEPVNKLLAKCGATKVFLEGDAIILALFERDGEVKLTVSRACVLAWEIVSLLNGYNGLLQRAGLPVMELGLGIAWQNSPPLYLMDGEHRIMISDAINESDRLSSCSKRVRKRLASEAGIFQVYTVQIGSNLEKIVDGVEELRLNYNVGGVCLSQAAFDKLQDEIALAPWVVDREVPGFSTPWLDREGKFFVGTVPLANGAFRQIVLRASRIPQVEVRDLSIVRWTDRWYYEVCANPAVYSALPGEKSAAGNS